jgi:hypothetical protein
MFETKQWYESLVKNLRDADDKGELEDPVLFVQVELGLHLLEVLDCTDEPAFSVSTWLANIPIPHAKWRQFDDRQCRALANARVLLRFGRFDWRAALKTYAALPAHWRYYIVDPQNEKTPAVREPNGPTLVTGRMSIYNHCLFKEVMPYRERQRVYAPAGRVVFRARQPSPRIIAAELDEAAIQFAGETVIPTLRNWPSPKQAPKIDYADLCAIARELDAREGTYGIRPQTGWERLVSDFIRYRLLQPDGSLGRVNSGSIELRGHIHLPGMVGAGKSTLIKLIAAQGALHGHWRTTIVVSDVITAITLADYFNRVLAGNATQPVAVPLLGRTTRYIHLAKLSQSSIFRQDSWMARWLDTRCALQGMVTSNELREEPLRLGDEPCERLYAKEEDINRYEKRLVCPLFSICPVHQAYRDMSEALIWITTPGAMGLARLPVQMETRQAHFGELIYHESDVVAFDEVEAIQQWFDNVYATSRSLIDSDGGSLGSIALIANDYLEHEDVISDHARRWVISAVRTREVALLVCDLLRRSQLLKAWVGQVYFTAHRLFSDLVSKLLGIESNMSISPQQEQQQNKLLEYFDDFHDDSIMPPFRATYPPVMLLHNIADAILARNGSIVDTRTADMCISWIRTYVPDIDTILQQLQNKAQEWDRRERRRKIRAQASTTERPDVLYQLAERLEFAIAVSVLTRLLGITFDEWYSAPPSITGKISMQDRLQRIPSDLLGVLPNAPTGSLFGFMHIDEEKRADDSAPGESLSRRKTRLLVFQYQGVGRWYVLHFHDLLEQLGYPGPGVLSLSGTSWLPDAASWHINVPPRGVMMTNPESSRAIEKSSFYFRPQRDSKGCPIAVSGSGDLKKNIWRLARELAGTPSSTLCLLQRELRTLKELEEMEQQRNQRRRIDQRTSHWQDRQRILLFVNSYDQVREVVSGILSKQPEWESSIYGLVRQQEDNDERADQWAPARYILGQQLIRGDIEGFGVITKGRILVAPLQAIGRGYNILNADRIAAFGSVFFLTRPMPIPFDMARRAQWMNRLLLDWCDNEQHVLWRPTSYADKGDNLRKEAHKQWERYEGGVGELTYGPGALTRQDRQKDLAASLAGVMIQACGRLLRGGVPFRATFVDAAWAPRRADPRSKQQDTADTSLLIAMIQLLESYCRRDRVARELYKPLVKALKRDFRDLVP